MPVYEKRADDGTVLERTVTLAAGHPSGYDEQMAALAAVDTIPWHRVDDIPLDDHQVVTALATGQFMPTGQPTPAAYSAAVAAASIATVPPFTHDDLKTEEV